MERNPVKVFTFHTSRVLPDNISKMPNIRALLGEIIPAGIGLFRVRFIKLSLSRSRYWFKAPAPPAVNAVPINVSINVDHESIPFPPR